MCGCHTTPPTAIRLFYEYYTATVLTSHTNGNHVLSDISVIDSNFYQKESNFCCFPYKIVKAVSVF